MIFFTNYLIVAMILKFKLKINLEIRQFLNDVPLQFDQKIAQGLQKHFNKPFPFPNTVTAELRATIYVLIPL